MKKNRTIKGVARIFVYLLICILLIIALVSCNDIDKTIVSSEPGVSLAGGIVNKEEVVEAENANTTNSASATQQRAAFSVWSYAELDKDDKVNASIFSFIDKLDVISNDRLIRFTEEEIQSIFEIREKLLFGTEALGESISEEESEDVYFDSNKQEYVKTGYAISAENLQKIANFEGRLLIAKVQRSLEVLNSKEFDYKTTVESVNRYVEGAFAIDLGGMQAFILYYEAIENSYSQPILQIVYISSSEIKDALEGALIDRYYVDISIETGKMLEATRERITLEQLLSGDNRGIYVHESSDAVILIEDIKNDSFWRQDAYELIEDVFGERVDLDDVAISRFDGGDEIITRVGLDNGDSYRVYYSQIERIPTKIKFSKALPPAKLDDAALLTGDEAIDIQDYPGNALEPIDAGSLSEEEVLNFSEEENKSEDE